MCRFVPGPGQMKEKEGYTHGERQIGKSTYPDDGIQLGHCHLLSTFNSLCDLLLVLEEREKKSIHSKLSWANGNKDSKQLIL